MITLDSIKDTWMAEPIKAVICDSGKPVCEAETKPLCTIPEVLRLPAERGGKTKNNFIW